MFVQVVDNSKLKTFLRTTLDAHPTVRVAEKSQLEHMARGVCMVSAVTAGNPHYSVEHQGGVVFRDPRLLVAVKAYFLGVSCVCLWFLDLDFRKIATLGSC